MILVSLAGLLLLPACERQVGLEAEVLAFLVNTESSARSFDYQSQEGKREVRVRGAFEDAFRYRGIVEIGGAEVSEQVVDDDALAVRVIDATKIPALTEETAPTSAVILDSLRGGAWVVDPSGAPPLRIKQDEQVPTGRDAFLDAVTVVDYLRAAITQAAMVKEWQEEDLEPAYRPSEDTFPKPNVDAGVRRFDLVRVQIPRPTQELGTLEAEPNAAMFRRMAIYVRNGRITQVREEIDIDGHSFFVDARKQEKKLLVDYMEQIKSLSGSQRITQREMTIEFANFGEKFDVRQPGDALRASLRGVFVESDEGEIPEELQQEEEAGSNEPSG